MADFDRTPPQDIAAEQSVLGAMMLSKDAIADVTMTIRGEDYYRPVHQTIHEVILDLFGRGEPVDAVTVAGQLKRRGDLERIGGAPYLHQLISGVPTAANAGYYARIVRERAQLRSLVQAGTRVVQLGYADDGGDVDELINQAQSEIYAVSERGDSEDYRPITEFLDETVTELQELQKNGGMSSGVPTGFYQLDNLTHGLHPGQLIIVAARPAMGKSTLALDFCRNAAIHHEQTSVIFSLEMDGTEISRRMISAESGVSMSRISSGDLEDADWTKIAQVLSRCSQAPLYIDDSPNMTMPEIRSKCRRLKQQNDLKLVVVDYLQLMSSGKRVESRQQEVAEFSRSLKLLAKELEIPVVAVAQLNRGPEQRIEHKPMLADLRESGSLEQDADVVMLLNRPEVYNQEDRPGEADVIVAKHRNGPTATIPLTFLGRLSKFGNPARE